MGQSGTDKDSWVIPAGSRGVRCGHRDLIGTTPCASSEPTTPAPDTLGATLEQAQSKDFSGFKGLGGIDPMPSGFACLHAYPLGHWGPISPACEGSIYLLKSALLKEILTCFACQKVFIF